MYLWLLLRDHKKELRKTLELHFTLQSVQRASTAETMFKISGLSIPDKIVKGEDKSKSKTTAQKSSEPKTAKKQVRSSAHEAVHDESSRTHKKDQGHKDSKSESKNSVPVNKADSKVKKGNSKDKKSKSQKKERDSNETTDAISQPEKNVSVAETSPSPVQSITKKKLTPLQLKMQQKLSGARFRWINEKLYTTKSKEAFDMIKETPTIFDEYHEGFRRQVESWPENPVHCIYETFKEHLDKPLNAPGGLRANPSGDVIVADLGCGEAELSLKLSTLKGGRKSKRAKFVVHSFDLAKANERVTVADIANTPLGDQSVHYVVICLALMGTNTDEFLAEAKRILKIQGELWIAEIKSRFDQADGKTDYSRFISRLKKLGFYHKSTFDENQMFVRFHFLKQPTENKGPKFIDADTDDKPLLKPCIYKKR